MHRLVGTFVLGVLLSLPALSEENVGLQILGVGGTCIDDDAVSFRCVRLTAGETLLELPFDRVSMVYSSSFAGRSIELILNRNDEFREKDDGVLVSIVQYTDDTEIRQFLMNLFFQEREGYVTSSRKTDDGLVMFLQHMEHIPLDKRTLDNASHAFVVSEGSVEEGKPKIDLYTWYLYCSNWEEDGWECKYDARWGHGSVASTVTVPSDRIPGLVARLSEQVNDLLEEWGLPSVDSVGRWPARKADETGFVGQVDLATKEIALTVPTEAIRRYTLLHVDNDIFNSLLIRPEYWNDDCPVSPIDLNFDQITIDLEKPRMAGMCLPQEWFNEQEHRQ